MSSDRPTTRTDTQASGLVGVVLAGGQSRRMGRDKARLRVAGSSLVEAAAERLRQATSEVLIADRGLEIAAGYRSISDGPGAGPIAGILGAAEARPGQDLLVLACDLPAVPPALLQRLAEPLGADAAVPRWRRGSEPLCARYRPSALAIMTTEARAGRLALHRMLGHDSIDVSYLEGESLAAFGEPARLFLNLNTPADLVAAGLDTRSDSMSQT